MVQVPLGRAVAIVAGIAGAAGAVSAQPTRVANPAQVLRSAGIEPNETGVRGYLASFVPDRTRGLRILWLVERLGDPRFSVRERAEQKLRALGASARHALARAAETAPLEVQVRATALLREMDESASRLLLASFAMLRTENARNVVLPLLTIAPLCTAAELRTELEETLRTLVTPAEFDALREAVRTGGPNAQWVAVVVLAERLTPDQLDALLPALASKSPDVRYAAARALADQGRRECLPVLADLLDAAPVELRIRSHAVLAASTGQDFGFAAYAELADRQAAIRRWRDWIEANGATAELRSPLRLDPEAAEVVAFWASTTGSALTRFDRQGRQTRTRKCDPYDVCPGEHGEVLYTDRNAGAVLVLDPRGRVLRKITGLSSPTDAELLRGGHILVLEGGNGRVSEFDAKGKKVWTAGGLNNPFDADRLGNGNTLVADSGSDRVVELNPQGRVVWTSEKIDFPNGVHRLGNGWTLVTTYTSGNAVMLDARGKTVWRTKVGGTLYSPRAAAGRLFVANSTARTIVELDVTGKEVGSISLGVAFNDIGYQLVR